ncbi:hypothetical protein EK0264_17660 [Epidermidibacterium keratini]|uniref:LppM domain-containing protein n=1 Tax=Epidermidibacterium keratini TaxID=1891644 RepID=A0A7L4YT20_9ACTN|nr:hypothetical protein [Epidermidibacterium keratini]QHC01919.1 hypothetical protein EK0264_17660 [Epidermidibacterium keratini]
MGHAGPDTARCRRGLALVSLWCVVLFALSGCLRYTADLELATDDTVTGTLVIAKKPPTDADGQPSSGPAASLEVPKPESTSERIVVEPYSHRGQQGYKITFDKASFADMGAFTPGGSRGGTLAFYRDGDQVKINMTIDLTYADNVVNEQITSTFEGTVALEVPGDVVETNGQVSGSVITWTLEPLALNSISATVDYQQGTATEAAAGESGGGIDWWVWAAAAALVTAGIAGWLTRRRSTSATTRDSSPTSSRPATGETTLPAAASTAAVAVGTAALATPALAQRRDLQEPSRTEHTSGPADDAAYSPGDDQGSTVGGWPPPRPHWRQ